MKPMRRDKSRRLLRRLVIKIFAPSNDVSQRRIILAGDGRHFTEEGVEIILEQTAAEIEAPMKGHEYHLVELGEPGHFNFVCAGERRYVDPRLKAIMEGTPAPAP